MTERLRWGILATGGIAHAFANDLKLNGFTVQAVGSRSQESADAFAAEFGIPNAHGSYEALAADPEVDVIYVSTPHPMHAAGATLALEAGKHVLVEKAFTVNAAEARALAELAASKGLLVLEAMWTRYLPHMARIREIIAEGVLGDLRTLIADHTQLLSDDPAHRINALELGGGALLDLGIYPVSFAWDLFGAPDTIHASATFRPTGADAQIAVVFGYEGGRMAVTHSASDAQGANTAVVLGTEARIEIDHVWYTPTTFRVVAADGTVLEEYRSEVTGRGMHFQAEAVERLVAAGTLTGDLLPIDETVAIMATLDEIRRQIGLAYPGE
ncbi:Gfo/Idh/MocA family oxidoreductase [Agromyces fucosus]|uniref:Gfo/Idh/MocA family oxidoreductase n=1 Tax=Agromyces fucosus TaxID=41985 RepID=A0A4Q2JRZ8_9MICO|nr:MULTISPECIES: Gfo/Idh/MocA family oxidoreductase [Agromyces]KQZ08829.1 oxidoreductase [Agromyces sp. Root1464]RXZ51131.1 Gfo/Idh/MocA family oxidoreductase [Agromyces fucosus]